MDSDQLCRERIISEDYRDFIVEDVRTNYLRNMIQESTCKIEVGFGYQCVYLPQTIADPITFERFSYNAIPRCYTLLGMEALNQAGILQIQNYPTLQLKGENIMIGFIDTGIDYANSIFRNLDGTTRIAGIWDQTVQSGEAPEGFYYGSAYTREQIDEALRSENPQEMVPSTDENGHGTFVASIACGGAEVSQQFLGAAPEATIGVVKLKPAKRYLKEFYFIQENAVCYQENDIMLGMKYLQQLAERLGMPVVFCIALGTNMGGHSANTPLPILIRGYSNLANHVIATGTGNEANQRHHYLGKLNGINDQQEVDIRVGENSIGFTMELWFDLPNILTIAITSPSGEKTRVFSPRSGTETEFRFILDRTVVYLEYRLSVEHTVSALISLRFQSPTAGIWRIHVQAGRISDGVYNIWLPVTEFLNTEVYFLESNPDITITTPGEVQEAITAAFYNGVNQSIGIGSGRGFTRTNQIKPDFAAPGVDVTGALPGGGFVRRTGSSAAIGITAGAVALLMEWIIYQLSIPVIEALELKTLLILGTQQKEGVEYPSKEWGYGTLDLYNVFEQVRRF